MKRTIKIKTTPYFVSPVTCNSFSGWMRDGEVSTLQLDKGERLWAFQGDCKHNDIGYEFEVTRIYVIRGDFIMEFTKGSIMNSCFRILEKVDENHLNFLVRTYNSINPRSISLVI